MNIKHNKYKAYKANIQQIIFLVWNYPVITYFAYGGPNSVGQLQIWNT